MKFNYFPNSVIIYHKDCGFILCEGIGSAKNVIVQQDDFIISTLNDSVFKYVLYAITLVIPNTNKVSIFDNFSIQGDTNEKQCSYNCTDSNSIFHGFPPLPIPGTNYNIAQ